MRRENPALYRWRTSVAIRSGMRPGKRAHVTVRRGIYEREEIDVEIDHVPICLCNCRVSSQPSQCAATNGGSGRDTELQFLDNGLQLPHSSTMQYSRTYDSSFTWTYLGNTYQISGSATYVSWAYGDTAPPCPQQGATSLQYTVPSGLGFPANCSFTFTPSLSIETSGAGGTVSYQNCGTVNPSLPAPPSSASTWSNLECWGLSGYPAYPINANYIKSYWVDWTPYDGNTTGSTGTGTDSMAYGQQISGTGPCGSLEIVDTADSAEWNALGVENTCGSEAYYTSCPSISNMEIDLQFVIPSNTNYQALEFDPDVTSTDSGGVTNYTHKISVACQFYPSGGGSAIWAYFDSSANQWYPFTNLGLIGGIPCNLSAGRHRLQLWVTVDEANHQYKYQELLVDNFSNSPQQPLLNGTLGPVQACNTTANNSPCSGFAPFIGVEQQVDNSTSHSSSGSCGGSNTVCTYYDNYSLVVW